MQTNQTSNETIKYLPLKRPKTLLVTSTRPGVGSVGELFLARLCKLFPVDKLSCVAGVAHYDIPVPDPALDWLPVEVFSLPAEYSWQFKDSDTVSKLKRRFFQMEMLKEQLAPRISAILQRLQTESYEVIWFVLNSPSMILMADEILAKSNLPAIAIVWDPISSIAEQGSIDDLTKTKLSEASDRVLKRLKACGVASYGMQKYLAEIAPTITTKVLINTPDYSKQVPKRLAKDKIVATFAGSAYAKDEIEFFIQALNSVNWQKAERKVELQIFSNFFNIPLSASGKKMNIAFKGHVSEEELFEELSRSHLAYLPYWFDKKYQEAVTRCFPNKLATYVAAGCPVLFHGPEKSSPAEFLSRYKVGKSVTSMNADELMRTLKLLTIDEAFLSNYENERTRAIDEELNVAIFEKRFSELLELACVQG